MGGFGSHGHGRGAGPTASYDAGQDAAGVRGEGLEICGHVGEATRDVNLSAVQRSKSRCH